LDRSGGRESAVVLDADHQLADTHKVTVKL